jgi:hypothetical protein
MAEKQILSLKPAMSPRKFKSKGGELQVSRGRITVALRFWGQLVTGTGRQTVLHTGECCCV